jgi:hypothetical protein
VGDLTDQIHDFNPGIRHSGLFWTAAVPGHALDANLLRRNARFHMRDVRVPDYHDFFNSISPHPKKQPGTVSFDVHWRGTGPRGRIRDATFGFNGRYRPAEMSIEFHVKNERTGAAYRSLPHGQITVGGGIGHERNGVFFR